MMIEDLHFHDARAEALTLLARRVDVLTLAKISGHKDIRMCTIGRLRRRLRGGCKKTEIAKRRNRSLPYGFLHRYSVPLRPAKCLFSAQSLLNKKTRKTDLNASKDRFLIQLTS